MDPCGTPVDICRILDLVFRDSTNCCLFSISCLLILVDFPESHNETIFLIILHDIMYRKPSIGQGRHLREYYFYP